MRKLTTTSALLGCLLVCQQAVADPASCAAHHEQGQQLLRDGKPLAATQEFSECAADVECPAQVRADCVDFFERARASTPSVVFSATDELGQDAPSMQVLYADGTVVASADGRAVELDPGPHEFTFKFPGGATIERVIIVRQGEKNRVIDVALPLKAQPQPEAAPVVVAPEPAPPAPPVVEPEPIPTHFWITTGIAVAGFGTFAAFGLMGNSKNKQLEACAPACGDEESSTYDAMKRDFLIADISMAVGVVSTGVALATLVAWGGSGANQPDPSQQALSGSIGPRGGSLVWRGRF